MYIHIYVRELCTPRASATALPELPRREKSVRAAEPTGLQYIISVASGYRTYEISQLYCYRCCCRFCNLRRPTARATAFAYHVRYSYRVGQSTESHKLLYSFIIIPRYYIKCKEISFGHLF